MNSKPVTIRAKLKPMAIRAKLKPLEEIPESF